MSVIKEMDAINDGIPRTASGPLVVIVLPDLVHNRPPKQTD